MTGGTECTVWRAVVHDVEMLKALAQWKSEKPMDKVLPIRFSDGTRLDHLQIDCASCTRILRPRNQRGEVSMMTADTYRLDGLAACDQCRAFTRFSFLCSGIGGLVTLEWKTGGKDMRVQVRATWLARLSTWLSKRK